MTTTLIITEKTSQARDLRAALGDRFGQILPAEGHLLRLAEPARGQGRRGRRWACVLLKPDGLYPTQPVTEGNKPAKLKAIAAALKRCDQVILATDCDREGQLIGQEILEHLRYRGTVQRALFTAQDPKSLRAGVRHAQAQPRAAPTLRGGRGAPAGRPDLQPVADPHRDRTLLARGVKGVIGIGRVKTPTLGHRLPARDRDPQFPHRGLFRDRRHGQGRGRQLPHAPAPPAKAAHQGPRPGRGDRARPATKHTGRSAVTVEHRRQAPPRLFDLPSLQKTCGQRWGWTADKTLAVAQELYDGDGKKLITYPRAEARYLAENQIADVPAIIAAHDAAARLRTSQIDPPVIRRGKSGHFCDKALEGVSHHAIVPNVNVMDDLEAADRPPQRRREAAVRADLPLLPRRRHAGLRVPPDRRSR